MPVKTTAVLCCFVFLIAVSGMWLFRYAPLGSFTGNGGGVFVYDRWNGNTLWMAGTISAVVEPHQQQLLKPVTDPAILKQLNK